MEFPILVEYSILGSTKLSDKGIIVILKTIFFIIGLGLMLIIIMEVAYQHSIVDNNNLLKVIVLALVY